VLGKFAWTVHRISWQSLLSVHLFSFIVALHEASKWALYPTLFLHGSPVCNRVLQVQGTSMLIWALQVSLSSAKVKDGYGGPLSSLARQSRIPRVSSRGNMRWIGLDMIRWCKGDLPCDILDHVDSWTNHSGTSPLIFTSECSLEQRQSNVDLQPAGAILFGQVFLGTLDQQRKT